MNIFYVSDNPKLCAQHLDDKRCVKMVLETAQLLSTALHVNNINASVYRPTHVNHPCTKWVSGAKGNYLWLLAYFGDLGAEYERRYGRKHKSLGLLPEFIRGAKYMPSGEFTPPPNCARNNSLDIDYTSVDDVCEAYKQYLTARWALDKRPPTWKNEHE